MPGCGDDDKLGDGDADADADTDADGDGGDGDGDGDGDSDADGDADEELCNGLDDDGDGEIDEGDPGGGLYCRSDLLGECATGHTQCFDSEVACVSIVAPEVETCANPGQDDDCNGTLDDIEELNGACDTGALGPCEVGAWTCDADVLVCQSGVAARDEICSNVVDDDCNGEIDEQPCAARLVLMLCGTSVRDVEDFIPPELPLELVSGCDADPQTQAMLISRNGSPDTQVLQDYVEGGGNVITELGNSAAVFNQVFDEAVREGDRYGDFGDNVQPPLQLGLDDPFWADNTWEAPEVSACGYDMANYPGIVVLGSWGFRSVSLAYRDSGAGRLWLVEADWQDGDDSFTDASLALMQYMVGY